MSLAAGGFIYVAEAFLNVGLLDFMLQLGTPFGSLAEEGGSAAALLGLFLYSRRCTRSMRNAANTA